MTENSVGQMILFRFDVLTHDKFLIGLQHLEDILKNLIV